MKHNEETTTEVVAYINIDLSQIDVLINYLSLLFWLKIILASSSGMSQVIHTDYNIEALGNASCEDSNTNQMIQSKAKEETNNNVGILFPNGHIHDECRPSQLILTDVDEMLPWDDQLLESPIYTPQYRLEAKKRYLEKKKKRKQVLFYYFMRYIAFNVQITPKEKLYVQS